MGSNARSVRLRACVVMGIVGIVGLRGRNSKVVVAATNREICKCGEQHTERASAGVTVPSHDTHSRTVKK